MGRTYFELVISFREGEGVAGVVLTFSGGTPRGRERVGEEGMRGRPTEREGDAGSSGFTGGEAVCGRGADGDEGILRLSSSTVGAS